MAIVQPGNAGFTPFLSGTGNLILGLAESVGLPHSFGMKRLLVLTLFAMAPLLAAPPTCERKGDVDLCERVDQSCASFVNEHLKADPSGGWMENWHGCLWTAIIQKGHSDVPGPVAPIRLAFAHVTVVPSYTDSERISIAVDVELANHKHRKYEYKDLPVVVRGGVPSASVTVGIELGNEIVGVPTIEATETGGKRTMSHSYR